MEIEEKKEKGALIISVKGRMDAAQGSMENGWPHAFFVEGRNH